MPAIPNFMVRCPRPADGTLAEPGRSAPVSRNRLSGDAAIGARDRNGLDGEQQPTG
jgi:hypothetical protein